MICVYWGERVAGSLIFCGGVDAKEIQYSVSSLQRLASLLLLSIAPGTGVGNGRDEVRFFLYTSCSIIIFKTEVSPPKMRKSQIFNDYGPVMITENFWNGHFFIRIWSFRWPNLIKPLHYIFSQKRKVLPFCRALGICFLVSFLI